MRGDYVLICRPIPRVSACFDCILSVYRVAPNSSDVIVLCPTHDDLIQIANFQRRSRKFRPDLAKKKLYRDLSFNIYVK